MGWALNPGERDALIAAATWALAAIMLASVNCFTDGVVSNGMAILCAAGAVCQVAEANCERSLAFSDEEFREVLRQFAPTPTTPTQED